MSCNGAVSLLGRWKDMFDDTGLEKLAWPGG